MNASGLRLAIDIGLRDARPGELDRLSRLLEEVYGEFQPHFPGDLWRAYLGEMFTGRRLLPARAGPVQAFRLDLKEG